MSQHRCPLRRLHLSTVPSPADTSSQKQSISTAETKTRWNETPSVREMSLQLNSSLMLCARPVRQAAAAAASTASCGWRAGAATLAPPAPGVRSSTTINCRSNSTTPLSIIRPRWNKDKDRWQLRPAAWTWNGRDYRYGCWNSWTPLGLILCSPGRWVQWCRSELSSCGALLFGGFSALPLLDGRGQIEGLNGAIDRHLPH